MKTALEWLEEMLNNPEIPNSSMLFKQAKEIETKQRQEDKLNGMKEVNELLDELIEKNMCSHLGDILIKQFKKRNRNL